MPQSFPFPTALLRPAAFVALALTAFGCGGKAGPKAASYPPNAPFEEVADLIKRYSDDKKKPPERIQDFRAYEPINPIGYRYLIQEKCVLFYGVSIAAGPEAARTVLAYDSRVPEEGGYVLMVDGTVKTVTADEFKAAPKASK